MPLNSIEIINLSDKGLTRDEARTASKWMAQAFADAPATPALTIFFGAAPYAQNAELHEVFWAAHLNRVARSGVLLGAKEGAEWRGFRCFFEPGRGRQPYVADFRVEENEDWDRFLALAGEERYMERVREWGEKAGATSQELGLDTSACYTTSIIVVDPAHQHRGIGRLLDNATQAIAKEAGKDFFIRIHEFILPFYEQQGYCVIASPTYTLQGSEPFKVHFLMRNLAP